MIEPVATDDRGRTVERWLTDPPAECAHCGAWTTWRYVRTPGSGVYGIAACDLRCAELRWRAGDRRQR